jgi:hypothetical protein
MRPLFVSSLAAAFLSVSGLAPGQVASKQAPVDSANPRTPSECVRYQLRPALSRISELSFAAYQQDTIDPAKIRVPFEVTNRMMDSAGNAIAKRCVGKFNMVKLPLSELAPLAELYAAAGEVDKINATVRYQLKHKLTPAERKDVLAQAMQTLDGSKGSKSKRIAYRNEYLAELDRLGDIALAERITKRVFFHDEDDTTAVLRRRHEAMALIRQLKDSAQQQAIAFGATYAYISVAQHYLDQGNFRAAEAIADSGLEAMNGWPQQALGELAGYAKFGEKMGPVFASNWFNVPGGFAQHDTDRGRFTLIEVTSYW